MTSAPSLSIPLHFASSSSKPISGPVVPEQWQYRWHRSDYPHSRDARQAKGEDEEECDDEWPDEDLKRWVTCMTTWRQYESEAKDGAPASSSPSPASKAAPSLQICLADENGEDVQLESRPVTFGSTPSSSAFMGGEKSGVKLALGLQNGTIWIFQERIAKVEPSIPPTTTNRARSASRNSVASSIITSPSLGASGAFAKPMEGEGAGSPMSPISGTSGVNASGSAMRNSSGVDAEERLETQWHAGRENHTMVGGMMEALGLNHANQHHGHTHSHSHSSANSNAPSGSSTPSSIKHQQSLRDARKESRASMINTPSPPVTQLSTNGRSRAASATTSTTVATEWDKESLADHERGERSRLSSLMSPGRASKLQRSPQAAPQEAVEEHEGEARPQVKKIRSRVEAVEELAVLQSSSCSPLVSLVKLSNNWLASLQEDGQLVLWSLSDATQLHSLNLKTTKSPPSESIAAAVVSSPSVVALSALRSGSNTPAPRSRTNSNATPPMKAGLEGGLISGAARLQSMQVVRGGEGSQKEVLLCFDDIKRKVFVVDAAEVRVVMVHAMSDCSSIPPVARLMEEDERMELSYVNTRGGVSSFILNLAPPKPSVPPIESSKLSHLSSASAFLRREGISSANSRATSIAEERDTAPLDLGKGGLQKDVVGLQRVGDDALLTWTSSGLQVMRRVADSLVVVDSLPLGLPFSIAIEGSVVVVETEAEAVVCQLHQGSSLRQVSRSNNEPHCQALAASSSPACAVRCCLDDEGEVRLLCDQGSVWQGSRLSQLGSHITASLPYSMERVVLSLSSGHLVMASLAELVMGSLPKPAAQAPRHKGHVSLLRLVVNPRTQARHVVGGTEEGDVIFWEASTLKLQSERSLLACPVANLVVLGKDDSSLRLNGCLACVGADGSLVVFLLDGLQHLYTIPGRGVPLEKMAVRADELLLLYEDARARLWDMKTLELRRSMGLDQAQALLDDGKGCWSEFATETSEMKVERGSAGVLASIPTSRDVASGAVTANLRRAIEAASRMLGPRTTVAQADDEADGGTGGKIQTSIAVSMHSAGAKKALHTLRPLMHCLMPLGLDRQMDECCRQVLDAESIRPTGWIGSGTHDHPGHLALALHSDWPSSLLCLSAVVTTVRLVGLTAMLLVVSNIEELQSTSSDLLTLLATLPALIGDSFQAPRLAMLVEYIGDPVVEIDRAAHSLFISTLDAMSQEEVDGLCDEWIGRLASQGGTAEQAGKALMLLGLIATERFTLMPPTLLKEVANSIALSMREEAEQSHQSTAIILCHRAFTIFQHYFDAMQILRSLFALSTSRGQEAGEDVPAQIRQLARTAVLRIAQDNTPLFMTTLSLDILHAQSPAHCNATMRLVALMVRTKPLILFPNLPRLAEAVVKSLDPTVTSLRTVVHRSATIIISELVATYPTIAFHKDLQRLAVGTFEGAVIMYDLKTSTRLYVIEAHQRSLDGLSFSHDGRRLVSISLADKMVKVWKTGVGFSAFLSFGGAPRQAGLLGSNNSSSATSDRADPSSAHPRQSTGSRGMGTSAYKAFEFGMIVPDDGSSVEAAHGGEQAALDCLRLVSFVWTGDRNVRLQVGETSMAFDVA